MAKFRVAVNRQFKNANGEREADFINCIAFKQTAELIARYFAKGSQIALDGRIQTGSYENQNGQKVYTTDIVVNNIYFTGQSNQNNNGNPQQNNVQQFNNNQQYNNQQYNQPSQNWQNNGFQVTSDDLPF